MSVASAERRRRRRARRSRVRRDDERALAADFHGGDAFVPAGDDLTGADLELERLVAISELSNFLPLTPFS